VENRRDDEKEEEELRHIFGRLASLKKWPWHGCMQLF